VAVTPEQRFGRAHLGACGQLALGEAVRAGFPGLLSRGVLLGPARAERALVPLSPPTPRPRPRELRRARPAGVEAVAPADAQVLVMQHDAFARAIEAVDRTHRHARRIGTVHARDRDRLLARLPIVDRDHPPAVHAPGHVVRILAGGDATVALDAAL